MKRPVVSVCAIVKNEWDRLPSMIQSARPIADEIVVIDTGSTDETQMVARRLGARVLEHPWTDDFAAARNASLDHARGEWILVLDADDRLLPFGMTMIRRALSWPLRRGDLVLTGYSLGIREQALDGTAIGTAASSGRLFPRSISRRYSGRVHEEVLYRGDRSKTRWGLLPGEHITHTGYDPSLMPAKYERNLRLLKLRLAEDENDIWAFYYLAMTYRNMGDMEHAYDWAKEALADGRLPISQHTELRRLLEELQRVAARRLGMA